VTGLIALIGFVVFAARRLLTYLHIFQQEEYDGPRFLRWLVHSGAFDRRLSLAIIVVSAAQLIAAKYVPDWLFPALIGTVCLGAAAIERDPRKDAKKALAMTARAKRIYGGGLALLVAIGVAAALTTDIVLVWLLPVQLVPVALAGATLLLAPSEARVQRRYWREAHAILQRIDPMVIAVTGSYGKTSVKHILGHVLETAAPTLITPGSVNTAMGIARIIREQLRPHHRYLVVEMGAYGIGSIARLCALTPPKLGIITAIGKAHYERFKTLDAVARAKFELAAAVCRGASRRGGDGRPGGERRSRDPLLAPGHRRHRRRDRVARPDIPAKGAAVRRTSRPQHRARLRRRLQPRPDAGGCRRQPAQHAADRPPPRSQASGRRHDRHRRRLQLEPGRFRLGARIARRAAAARRPPYPGHARHGRIGGGTPRGA
jgi:uncharacterized membrane protein